MGIDSDRGHKGAPSSCEVPVFVAAEQSLVRKCFKLLELYRLSGRH